LALGGSTAAAAILAGPLPMLPGGSPAAASAPPVAAPMAAPLAVSCASANFLAAANYAAGTGAIAVAVGDLNRDGNPDLVSANWTSNNVSVLLSTGSGGFGG